MTEPPYVDLTIRKMHPLDSVPNYTNTAYNWDKFLRFDEIARRALADSNVGAHILNINFTALRPDAHPGHRDCGHMCVPGPLNAAAAILMDMIESQSQPRALSGN